MKRRTSRKSVVLAAGLALLATMGAAAATVAAGEVIKSGVGFEAAGQVVAKSADQIVVRTDDHGHRIAFAVDRSTEIADVVEVGSHVRIVYHPMGSTGQTADEVEITAREKVDH